MAEQESSGRGLSDRDRDALRSWSNVGAPGPAPETRFVPTPEQQQRFKPIAEPRSIDVGWVFDDEAYARLWRGHQAQSMEDKWTIYLDGSTVHFHRSWTGMEMFRFDLRPVRPSTAGAGDRQGYAVDSFTVEQDPARFAVTENDAIERTLSEVLQAVLGVSVRPTH